MSQEYFKEIDEIQRRIENSRNLRDIIRLKQMLKLSEAALWQIGIVFRNEPRSPSERISEVEAQRYSGF